MTDVWFTRHSGPDSGRYAIDLAEICLGHKPAGHLAS